MRGGGKTVADRLPPQRLRAFFDGSVRFLKETINSWRMAGCDPVGIGFDGVRGSYTLGTAIPGVLQALSTRGSGEVISADAL